MEKRELKIIDIYFNKGDDISKVESDLKKEGYHLEHEDDGSNGYDFCNQYYKKTIITKL